MGGSSSIFPHHHHHHHSYALKLKLLALVLALFAVFECSSVSAWGIWLDPVYVSVRNDLWNGTLLSAHCKSKDDDLGEHALKYKDSYEFTFKINYWGTTLFWCNFGFADTSGKPVLGGYQVYKAKRDVKKIGQFAEYSARLDGLYVSPQQIGWELVYAWPK